MPESQLPVPTEKEIEAGKTMALLSWLSGLVGLPLWIIPMVQRDNAFALYHAKHAAMTFILQIGLVVIYVVLATITCGMLGILFPIIFLAWIPMIDGIIKATGGRTDPPLIVGGLTDMIFGGLTVDEDKRPSDD